MRLLAHAYLDAKAAVIEAGFADEIEWQHRLLETSPTVSDFLRETAWVILSAGMDEAVVRAKFPAISAAFYDWQGIEPILSRSDECKDAAMDAYGHAGKVDAIIAAAAYAERTGITTIQAALASGDVSVLAPIPFVGPVTVYHLAKNLGVDTAKPDRHLRRIAEQVGYQSALELCAALSSVTADPVAVVDIVLWRWAKLGESEPSVFRAVRPARFVGDSRS